MVRAMVRLLTDRAGAAVIEAHNRVAPRDLDWPAASARALDGYARAARIAAAAPARAAHRGRPVSGASAAPSSPSTRTPTTRRCSPAGTLARLAAEGHRVVLVVATAGEAGLASRAHARDLGARRRARAGRLRRRARRVPGRGARVRRLRLVGNGPGRRAPAAEARLCRVPVDEAAAELARLLVEERADVLTTYDAAGGYGHPDHVQVHRVGRRAAELAGTPLVLEATVDRPAAAAGGAPAGPAGAGAAAAGDPGPRRRRTPTAPR